MSGFFETSIQDEVLDTYWGSGTPAVYYIALFEVMPGPDGSGGTEASYSGYARAAVTNNATEWPAASGGAKSNANEIDYGAAGSGPTDIVGFGFYDDPTSVLQADFWAAVTVTSPPVTINNGADVKFPAGAIDLAGCA